MLAVLLLGSCLAMMGNFRKYHIGEVLIPRIDNIWPPISSARDFEFTYIECESGLACCILAFQRYFQYKPAPEFDPHPPPEDGYVTALIREEYIRNARLYVEAGYMLLSKEPSVRRFQCIDMRFHVIQFINLTWERGSFRKAAGLFSLYCDLETHQWIENTVYVYVGEPYAERNREQTLDAQCIPQTKKENRIKIPALVKRCIYKVIPQKGFHNYIAFKKDAVTEKQIHVNTPTELYTTASFISPQKRDLLDPTKLYDVAAFLLVSAGSYVLCDTAPKNRAMWLEYAHYVNPLG